MSNQNQTPAALTPTGDDRLPWIAPAIATFSAGGAEAGPNPIAPEGAFADGS